MNDRANTQLPDIIRDFTRASPELVKQASQYAASILADVAGRPELNQDDGIHPTAEGTELIAERIWAVLKPALSAAN